MTISLPRLAAALAPVAVGLGVAAHLRQASLPRSLGAVALAIALQFLLQDLRGPRSPAPARWPRTGPATLIWLGISAALGIWLGLGPTWWLLPLGALCLVLTGAWLALRPGALLGGFDELSLVLLLELAAGWGTILLETHRLPVLGLLAGLLPAALAAGLLLVRDICRLQEDLEAGRVSAAVRLGGRRTRQVLGGFIGFAALVPLLITLPGLEGAECFLPWVSAPLAEGPLRNAASSDAGKRSRALRDMALLLAAASALMALGVWSA